MYWSHSQAKSLALLLIFTAYALLFTTQAVKAQNVICNTWPKNVADLSDSGAGSPTTSCTTITTTDSYGRTDTFVEEGPISIGYRPDFESWHDELAFSFSMMTIFRESLNSQVFNSPPYRQAQEGDANLVDDKDEVTDCPVVINSGVKIFDEVDYKGVAGDFPLSIVRHYRSDLRKQKYYQAPGIFGTGWTSSFDMLMQFFFNEEGDTPIWCVFKHGVGVSGNCLNIKSDPPEMIMLVDYNQRRYFKRDYSYIYGELYRPDGDSSASDYFFHEADDWIYVAQSGKEYRFNYMGRIEEIANPYSGGLWKFHYTNNTLSYVEDSSSRRIDFEFEDAPFDSANRQPILKSIQLPNGHSISYDLKTESTFSSTNYRYLEGVSYPNGTGSRTYEYDDGNNTAAKITGLSIDGVPWGEYEYAAAGNVLNSGLVNGTNKSTFDYDFSEGTVSISNAKSGITDYVLDDDGTITEITESATNIKSVGQKEFVYSGEAAQKKLDAKMDFNGTQTTYEYYSDGKVRYEYKGGVTREFVWDVAGRLVLEQTWDGAKVSSLCNSQSCPTPKSIPSRVVENKYGDISEPGYWGRLKYTKRYALEPDGITYTSERVTKYSYEFHEGSKVKSKMMVDGPQEGVDDTATYSYNVQGDLTEVESALGHKTVFRYVPQDGGLPYQITYPSGLTMAYQYDTRGRVIKKEEVASGKQIYTEYEYYGDNSLKSETRSTGYFKKYKLDSARRLDQIEEPDDIGGTRVRHFAYDALNNLEREWIDLLGTETHLQNKEYDEFGNLGRNINVDGHDNRFEYYSDGRLKRVTNAYDFSKNYTYNDLGFIESHSDGGGDPTINHFNSLGQLERVVSPNGSSTTYKRNGFGEIVEIDSPDSGLTKYVYTASGAVAAITKNGNIVNYEYDSMGRVILIYGDNFTQIEFEYDSCGSYGNGKLCKITDGSGHTEFTYTSTGKIASKKMVINGVSNYIYYYYDQYDRLKEYYVSSGMALVKYGYNSRDEQVSLEISVSVPGFGTKPVAEYRTVPGIDQWTFAGSFQHEVYKDSGGRIKQISNRFYNKKYEYDKEGRVSKIDGGYEGLFLYRYDGAGRLNTVLEDKYYPNTYSKLFYFDESGNRTRKKSGSSGNETLYSYYPGSNMLAKVGDTSFERDANGNLVSQVTSFGWNIYNYEYDGLNRMIAYDGYPNGRSTYQYNYLNQRVYKNARQRDPNGNLVTNTFYYIYGQNGELLLEKKGTSGFWKNYFYLDGKLVGYLTPDLKIHYVTVDNLGRPDLVFQNENGVSSTEIEIANYDFGRSTNLRSSDFNIGFPGQYYDNESRLWYNWNRYYDEGLGRYIQSDPVGLAAGINPFTYVDGDPINKVDPTGLDDYGNYPSMDTFNNWTEFWENTKEPFADVSPQAAKAVSCLALCGLVGEAESIAMDEFIGKKADNWAANLCSRGGTRILFNSVLKNSNVMFKVASVGFTADCIRKCY